jgi:GTP-binding protein
MSARAGNGQPASKSEEAPEAGFSPEELEAARRLFAQSCIFIGAAAEEAQLPETSLPEVAFAGRSNVGKSSLINALTGRKTLARTSGTPGRTRQINFFDLGGRLLLVDLPGFGYARASRGDVERWTGLVRRYLRGRAPLRRAFLLIDARHGPKDIDRATMAELDQAAVSYQVVLTKADKPKPAALAEVRAATAAEVARRPAAHPDCVVTSALSGLGIAELRARIAALAAPARAD